MLSTVNSEQQTKTEPVGLRRCNVVVEQKFLVIVLLREDVDDVGLELVLCIGVQPS